MGQIEWRLGIGVFISPLYVREVGCCGVGVLGEGDLLIRFVEALINVMFMDAYEGGHPPKRSGRPPLSQRWKARVLSCLVGLIFVLLSSVGVSGTYCLLGLIVDA